VGAPIEILLEDSVTDCLFSKLPIEGGTATIPSFEGHRLGDRVSERRRMPF